MRKAISRLPEHVHGRVSGTIDGLVGEPRPSGCVRMSGSDLWRIRVGDYRIVYSIDDDGHVIEILTVAHRREAYR